MRKFSSILYMYQIEILLEIRCHFRELYKYHADSLDYGYIEEICEKDTFNHSGDLKQSGK